VQAAYAAIDFQALESEVKETQEVCSLTDCPLVFGHNDLLSGNILIMQQPGFDPTTPDRNGRIVFIDYEYGAYTYRDFDIGNHFTEYAGFDGDYDRWVVASAGDDSKIAPPGEGKGGHMATKTGG
jgi:ethanolamine kinase